MNTLYTIGYTGRSIDELADIAKTFSAGIVDIRFSAWSREPKWRYADLLKSMQHRGIEYCHIPELGNVNYDSLKPIDIAKPEEGREILAGMLKQRNQIILCACSDASKCHRAVVGATMAENYGCEVVHLGEPEPTEEPAEIQGELW